MRRKIYKSGGSLVMTIPSAFVEQNGLKEGYSVDLDVLGSRMIIETAYPARFTLKIKQTLRKIGGSLAITIPKIFIDKNGLKEGSRVNLNLMGSSMTVDVDELASYTAKELMVDMPGELPLVDGWGDML